MTLTASPFTIAAPGEALSGALAGQVAGLGAVVGGLDPALVAAQDAPGVWDRFDQIERLAAAGKLLMARRVEDSGAWQAAGLRSAAEFLALRAGTSREAARNMVETSKRLPQLPGVDAALRAGELSAAQAHPIADAAACASNDPVVEAKLLDTAKTASLKELRDECLRRKMAADPNPERTRRRIKDDRFFRHGADLEGAWRFWGRGPLENAGAFDATLKPIIDKLFKQARAEGRHDSRDALAYDALHEMARLAHAALYGYDPEDHDNDEDPGNDHEDPRGGPDQRCQEDQTRGSSIIKLVVSSQGQIVNVTHIGQGPYAALQIGARIAPLPERPPPVPRYLALIHLSVESIAARGLFGDETCVLPGVGEVSAPGARELVGSTVLGLVRAKGVAVAQVVHRGRKPTTAQRMALLWTHPDCTVEGCPHTITQIDHRDDWHLNKITELANLDPLCGSHHWLKTHRGWALVAGIGKRAFVPPDHPHHPHLQLKGDQPAPARAA